MLCALAVRRHVGTLIDVQPFLVFMMTILDVLGVAMMLQSPPPPPGVVRLGLASFLLVLGVDICSFVLDRMGVSCCYAPLSCDVCSSPSGDRRKWFCLCVMGCYYQCSIRCFELYCTMYC